MYTLKYLSQIYMTHFKLDMAVRFQYRADTVFYVLTVILLPVIYLSVWSTAAGSDQIGGYSQRGFAAYYIAVLITNHFTDTWTMWLYEDYVRSGSFSHELLRPLHPVHVEIAPNLTHKIFSLIFLIPTVIVLVFLFQPELNILSLIHI